MANSQTRKIIPGIPMAALEAVSDRNARDVLRAIVDGLSVRNNQVGSGDERFITARDLSAAISHAPTKPAGSAGLVGFAGASLLAGYPGAVEAQVGTLRYYPRTTLNITALTAWLSAPATSAVTAAVRKNGAVVALITIAAGAISATQVVATTVLPTDYLTLDIQSGAGTDFTIRLDY